jgi:hypothetical protein
MAFEAFSSLGDSVTIAGTNVSQSTVLPQTNNTLFQGKTIRIYNAAGAAAFFRTGIGPQTAVLTDTFVAPGSTEVFSVPPNVTEIGVILASGTGNVFVQLGAGL